MAYQLIFRFTGQGNYAGARIVNWSRFSVSGDTDKNIGQILSISYEHWHTSVDNPTRALRGRITLSDGTVFVSEPDSHRFLNDVVKFTNSFSELLTPEQLAQIATIETINESGANNQTGYSSKLYWRATGDYPMRIIVTFEENSPTYYAPSVDSFIVGRCDETGAENPEGLYIMTTLKLSIGNSAGLSDNMSMMIYYAQDGVPTLDSPAVDLTARASELLSGVYKNTQIIPGTWAAGSSWEFMAVFQTGGERAATKNDSVGAAYAPMFISRDKKHVSFNGFPRRTDDAASVEFNEKAYFYEGFELGGGGSALSQLGVQYGQTEAQSVSSGGVRDYVITFDKAYAAAPVVIPAMVGSLAGSSAGELSVLVRSVSATGCTIRVASATTTFSVAVAWVALGELAG